MLESRQEEIISILWAICALLAFSNEYTVYGWFFGAMSTFHFGLSIVNGIIEVVNKKEKENKNEL